MGREACGAGSAYALRRRGDGKGDVIGHPAGNAAAILLFGATLDEYFGRHADRAAGPNGGGGGQLHGSDFRRGWVGPVGSPGTMVEVIAGMTLAFRLRGEGRVGIVYEPEGATAAGAWHEGVSLRGGPALPPDRRGRGGPCDSLHPGSERGPDREPSRRAEGYGVAGESVDGDDVLAVYKRHAPGRRTGEAWRGRHPPRAPDGRDAGPLSARLPERASERGPGEGSREGSREGEEKDPLGRYRSVLVDRGRASEAELDEIVHACGRAAGEAARRVPSEPLREVARAPRESTPVDRRPRPGPAIRSPIPAVRKPILEVRCRDRSPSI